MYVAMRRPRDGGAHVEVTVERGPGAGTWRVTYDPAGPFWRVHSAHRREHVLRETEPWIGDLGGRLDDLMSEIGRRAVAEMLHREASQPQQKAKPRAVAA